MNLLFIAIDTLRSDHLSCYGYERGTSPNIDAVAARGALVSSFYGVGNCTHPGFTAMLTGCFPETTGVVSHWTRIDLPPAIPTMAELFQRAGYKTCAIDNLFHGWVKRGFREYSWFRRGYDEYAYPTSREFYQPSDECIDMACQWLADEASDPFLLFVHLWDPHSPYNKAPKEHYRFYDGDDPCDPRLDVLPAHIRDVQRRVFQTPLTDPRYVEAAYDAEIHYSDAAVGRLMRQLESLRLADDTVVVITADHGEIMGRPRLATGRPWAFSHIGLSEDTVRVPFIVAGGIVPPSVRVSGPYQLVDILPTVVELCGLEPGGARFDGVSIVEALSSVKGDGREAVFFSENTYQKQRGVVRGPWKYLRMESPQAAMPMRSLYNLTEDPQEQLNVADMMPDVAQDLDSVLSDYVSRTTGKRADPLLEQALTHPVVPPESYTKY